MPLLKLISLLLLLSLSALDARSQAFTPRRPFVSASSGPFNPLNLPGLVYWWDYRDLNTNNTAVITWPDRIWTNTLASGTSSTYPTGTVNGVQWTIRDPKPYLTMTNVWFDTNNYSVWFLWIPDDPAGASRDIFARGAGGFMGWNNSHQWIGFTTYAPLTQGTMNDCCVVWGSSGDAYTNGVLCKSIVAATPWLVKDVGGNADGNYIAMRMLVMLYLTNVVSAANVANLHTWATNLFHYAP